MNDHVNDIDNRYGYNYGDHCFLAELWTPGLYLRTFTMTRVEFAL